MATMDGQAMIDKKRKKLGIIVKPHNWHPLAIKYEREHRKELFVKYENGFDVVKEK